MHSPWKLVLFGGILTILAGISPVEGKVTKNQVEKAVKKGVKYLIAQQQSNGSWQGQHGSSYPMGTTSICVLTLLKCDTPHSHLAVKKAFAYLDTLTFQRTYGVALYIMALEAKYTPGKKILKKYEKKYSRGTIVRKVFQRHASPKDRKKLKAAVQWLLQNRSGRTWRYPGGGEDNSNTQYVMLAFSSAQRMGVPIKRDVYWKVAEHFVETQDKSGPKVKPFDVPAAEEPIHKVLRKRFQKKLQKSGGNTVERRQKASYGRSRESQIYQARGWSYEKKPATMEGVAQNKKWHYNSTGSMTTAGIAALVICKAELEKYPTRRWKQNMQFKVNRSIRDGCAWMAHNFKVNINPPNFSSWVLYYLYGLQRAGILTGIHHFGRHDWYMKGAKAILKQQKADGSISRNDGIGPIPNTCFGLLFLQRATVPLRKAPPKRIITGSGR